MASLKANPLNLLLPFVSSIATIAAPMVHDTLPFIKKKSYLNKEQIPFKKFEALLLPPPNPESTGIFFTRLF